jgi:hypothetical protein
MLTLSFYLAIFCWVVLSIIVKRNLKSPNEIVDSSFSSLDTPAIVSCTLMYYYWGAYSLRSIFLIN